MRYKLPNQKGFNLIEVIIYIFITAVLMITISGLVMTVIFTRRYIESSNSVFQNARFMVNFLTNQIHNVDRIDDVTPDPSQLYFYQLPDTRFSLIIDNNNLIFQETHDEGSGFPDQDTAAPLVLNSSDITVASFTLDALDDGYGNTNQGAIIKFTLIRGNPSDHYGYIEKDFQTFISIR
jgi:Tfp pilus assembly protein PilE